MRLIGSVRPTGVELGRCALPLLAAELPAASARAAASSEAVELRELRAADLLGPADNAACVLEYALERATGLPSAQLRPDESTAVLAVLYSKRTAEAPKPWENLLDLREALTAAVSE